MCWWAAPETQWRFNKAVYINDFKINEQANFLDYEVFVGQIILHSLT